MDKKKRPKLVDFNNVSEFRAALELAQRELPHLIASAKLTAKLRRATYLAYIEEGFTEAQALDLCTK